MPIKDSNLWNEHNTKGFKKIYWLGSFVVAQAYLDESLVVTRDSKELWNETYSEAKDEGLTDDEAIAKAQLRVEDYLSSLIDDARDRAKHER